MRSPRPACFVGVLLGLLGTLTAPERLPAQSPAPGANLLGDTGGFEKVATTDDVLWDGVNSNGILAVPTFSALVVTERSAFAPLAMPPSVAVADLNGDGKPDLLVAGPNGYFFFYANSGTLAEPRFTSAELLPLYLSTTFRQRNKFWERDTWDAARYCPRISLADWRGRGLPDLLIGNYMGEMLLVPNEGSAQRAVFRQPASLDTMNVPTDEHNRLWGNLLSPVSYDWNGDGKLDLIVGEGTYSANSIRLMENLGGSAPKFSEAKATFLAYGDGREQLIPAVVDFNGDGKPDLLVSDRSREIGVYLNTGEKGSTEALARTSTLSFGGKTQLPGFASLCVADFNGDGLFDLVLGLDNGHLAVAFNKGSKGQPEFGPVQELKGQDRIGKTLRRPAGWSVLTRPEYGNAMAYITVVTAAEDPASAPPEGKACLKAGYWPVANSVFPYGPEGIPGGVRRFSLEHQHISLETGKNYTLSFRVKNSGMERMHYSFNSRFDDYVGAVKQELDDRQRSRKIGERVVEVVDAGGDFSAGNNWSTQTKTINVRYKNPALQNLKEITGDIQIEFWSRTMSDVVYFDDIQLVEAKGG